MANLKRGFTKSCGCLNDETRGKPTTTHGLSEHAEYQIWTSIKQRCYNPHSPAFKDYGARGIQLHEPWRASFPAFLAGIGKRPPGLTLDRIDNNRSYEPGNVRWATRAQQANNRRYNRYLTYDGVTMNETQWEQQLGLRRGLVAARRRAGWSVERALTTPVRHLAP